MLADLTQTRFTGGERAVISFGENKALPARPKAIASVFNCRVVAMSVKATGSTGHPNYRHVGQHAYGKLRQRLDSPTLARCMRGIERRVSKP